MEDYDYIKAQEELNKDRPYYIKILNDEKNNKYKVFYVNKNLHINKKMGNLMKNYNFLEFSDKFNKPLDNLPSNIENIKFGNKFTH